MNVINIRGSARAVPNKVKYSSEIDCELGKEEGFVAKKTGIETRYFNTDGTAAELAATAIRQALINAEMAYADLDVIIAASGTPQQIIPCNASLIAEQFLAEKHNIPCFDVNATCLSFISAFEVAAAFLETGKFKNILVVSAESGDGALNKGHYESYALIGNAAAAYILSNDSDRGQRFEVIDTKMCTYAEFSHAAEIRAGGSALYLAEKTNKEDYYFDMNGIALMKAMLKNMPDYMDDFLAKNNIKMQDVNHFVPHQASGPGINILAKALKIPKARIVNIIRDYGNTIAAAIPFAFDYLLEQESVASGDYVMLIGTGAGVSIGTILLRKV
ncbi:3-oxoacyl-[acyl-carrier-protein] synthase III C-terminal domain-containing protein [Culicoidibacter larvae]|uniref:Beta-ketoacyl-ACP synthase III n=1 Tax=Culicoidibacter larvae TaxID=2579976 RepID=A0A5R8QGZ2_9FIRM|nr:3-oxoacyl-[acyl-carrier-protein] synthase III C-terminal domain-containing protein [Culicoidibacter larvae]TLG77252.1 beta-ketoacyl-ACP synthase III [Culicoidibacter larvae]